MSIGLVAWVAYCQTRYYRSGDEIYLRMTRFWGKFMLISVAVGVVTGIVQEFQFGMNWSEYSRYVGDIFGAPLAMEGLAAFFLESTFVGLWIFGWGKLSPKVHLATIWLTSLRHDPLGVLHPRRQLVDAASRRLRDQSRHPPRRTEEHLRRAHQLNRAAGFAAHDLRGNVHRRLPRAGDLSLRHCCASATSTFTPARCETYCLSCWRRLSSRARLVTRRGC